MTFSHCSKGIIKTIAMRCKSDFFRCILQVLEVIAFLEFIQIEYEKYEKKC